MRSDSHGDPVSLGLVASLNRPGGNATGMKVLLAEMDGKRLGLLRDMVPTAHLIAALLNPRSPVSAAEFKMFSRPRARCRDLEDAVNFGRKE